MKSNILLSLLSLAACGLAGAAHPDAAQPDALRVLATAPLRFEPAVPGAASQFVARGSHFHYEFTPQEAALRAGGKEIRLHFEGANQGAQISGADLERSVTNLYLGNDPAKWRQAVPNYGRVQVQGLYPGIDLTYYGNGTELEYDVTVKPGANPHLIKFCLQGEDAILDRRGDLVSALINKRPVAYQLLADGSRRVVGSSYRKNSDGTYGFALGKYDHRRELVIDPVLILGQYLSGTFQDAVMALGHDSKGLIYAGGVTNSGDIPLAGTSLQTANGGGADLFLAVINPKLSQSSQITYVTYIGGSNDEIFGGMQVSANGDVYLTGATDSPNFPLQNAPQTALAGSTAAVDAFALWLTPTQTLQFSTFFGGSSSDAGKGIAVDSKGVIWVAGDTQSSDLPETTAIQSLVGTQNLFIAGFDPSKTAGATEIYATYLGGTHWDEAFALAVAKDGTLWLAGGTFSDDIPVQGAPHTYQGNYGGDGDAYIAHVDPTKGASALLYATFLGGSGIDEATSMLIDPAGRIVVTGYTLSTNFPVTSGAFQKTYGGNTDAFVTILDPAISVPADQLIYSTYFGGAGADSAFDVKQDSGGILYVSGYTESAGLPGTANALQPEYDGSLDGFGLKLDTTKAGAEGIDYFTYIGSPGLQIAYAADFDASGDMLLAGSTTTGLLGRFGGVERGSVDGNVDAFVMAFAAATAPVISTPSSVSASAGMLRRRHLPVLPHR